VGALPRPIADARRAHRARPLRLSRHAHRRGDARKRPRPGCTFHRAWHTADGSSFYALAHWRTREGAQGFSDEWQIEDEPGEVAIVLEGDVGLVPLGGDE
jgi:hypothetical protein